MSDPSSSDPASSRSPIQANNLQFLQKQAKALLRAAQNGDAEAINRFRNVIGAKSSSSLKLAHAQKAIATEAGFSSWEKMRSEVQWRTQTRAQHRLGSATKLNPGEIMNASTQSLRLGPIDQIGVSCGDLDQAHHFYADILGLRPSGEVPGSMKFFDCGGITLVLFKGESKPSHTLIYFRVDPEPGLIERKITILKSQGVHMESDAHLIARNWNGTDVWIAFFRDPFGNLLGLKSNVPAVKR